MQKSFYLAYQKLDQKIKKETPKLGLTLGFQMGPNLKNILSKSKGKLIPNSYL